MSGMFEFKINVYKIILKKYTEIVSLLKTK